MQCTKHYLKLEILTDLDRIYEWRGQIQLFYINHKTAELNRSRVYNRGVQHNIEGCWVPWAYSEVSLL